MVILKLIANLTIIEVSFFSAGNLINFWTMELLDIIAIKA